MLIYWSEEPKLLQSSFRENKLVVYDNCTPAQQNVEYPDYLEIEPLKLECQHFLSCIEKSQTPRTDGENGYKVVRILEEADRMMLGNRYEELNKIQFNSSRSKVLK